MKNIKKIAATVIAASTLFMFTGCFEELLDDSTVTVTVNPASIELTPGTAGSSKDVEVNVKGSDSISVNDVTVQITDANGKVSTDLNVTSETVKEDTKELDITLTISTTSNATNGTYSVKVIAAMGATEESKTIAVTVTGASEGTPATEASATIYNPYGAGSSVYDLVGKADVSAASGPDATTGKLTYDAADSAKGDIAVFNNINRESTLVGKVTSLNGAMFVAATAADYDNATVESIATLAATATASDLSDLATGSYFAIKLGGNRGSVVVKVTEFNATDDSNSTSNTGKLAFSYKM